MLTEQRCRWGRDADGAEMQMGQRCRLGRDAEGRDAHWGREADMQIYREIHWEKETERHGERGREGDRETIPAICTDRHTGNYTIIDTDQRQSH